MDQKFNSLLSIVLIPQTVSLIVEKDGMEELSAMTSFYKSKIYDLLCKEETKIWHLSPLAIYTMYKHEKETGEIAFPEE